MTSAAGTTVSVHPLHGLEPDNLLAFLALLGLLRALEASQPQWQPRVDWAGDSLAARLHLSLSVTSTDIVAACDQGISLLQSAYVFDRPDPNYTAEQFRSAFHGSSGMERERLAAALGSTPGDKAMKWQRSPYCTHVWSGASALPRAPEPRGQGPGRWRLSKTTRTG